MVATRKMHLIRSSERAAAGAGSRPCGRLDRLHLEFPFAGSRMLRGWLAAEGCKTGRCHVKTLMRRMGIEALYRRPYTSKHPEPGHKIYPYLLRGVEVPQPNPVWAMDITYIPMARGFVYLAVVLDWFNRCVPSWRVSITIERRFAWKRLRTSRSPPRAGDLQHGSGQPVHRHGIHQRVHQKRHRHLRVRLGLRWGR